MGVVGARDGCSWRDDEDMGTSKGGHKHQKGKHGVIPFVCGCYGMEKVETILRILWPGVRE